MAGWIKIHRSMREHWVFSKPEYLKAWVTILMEVNHAESKVLINGKLMVCKRGESLKSLDSWGSLFGSWSKNRVYRFLNLLKKDNMIELKNETVTTRLTVCNYCKYQENGNGHDTEAEQVTKPQAERQAERRRNTNKNVKNGENEKNEKKETDSIAKRFDPKKACPEFVSLDIWLEWIEHKKKVKASLSERAMVSNINKLIEYGKEVANEVIAQSLDSGYKGLFPLKQDNSKNNQTMEQHGKAWLSLADDNDEIE